MYLPRDALWLDTFFHELLAFPGGRHDDQVDSVSQFLYWTGRDDQFADSIPAAPILIVLEDDDYKLAPNGTAGSSR